MPFPSGSITILPAGALIQSPPTVDIMINGASLNIQGLLNIRYLWTQSGTLNNSGTMELTSFLNEVPFINNGIIQHVDSIFTTADFTNNGSLVDIDSITVGAGVDFINNGICVFNQFTNNGVYSNNNHLTFTDITNNGTMINMDTVLALNSCWNMGFWNLLGGSYTHVNKSFLNGLLPASSATLNVNGKLIIDDSWYNVDLTSGSTGGRIQVADSSLSWGSMLGSFDFCDLTPPSAGGPPWVDYNFGTASNQITWCTYVSMSPDPESGFEIFPNPAKNTVYIHSTTGVPFTLDLFSITGQLLVEYGNAGELNISDISPGIYYLRISTDQSIQYQKIQIHH